MCLAGISTLGSRRWWGTRQGGMVLNEVHGKKQVGCGEPIAL